MKLGYKVVKKRVKQAKKNEGSSTKVEDDRKLWGEAMGIGHQRENTTFPLKGLQQLLTCGS